MINYLRHIIALIFTIAVFAINGQVNPVAQVDRDSILIGEQIVLTLAIPYDITKPHQIKWPKLENNISKDPKAPGFEIVAASKIDTSIIDKEKNPNLFVQSRQLKITCFDSGYIAIPPFDFGFNGRTLVTKAVLITVTAPKVSILDDFKDVKGIVEVEYSWKEFILASLKWLLLSIAFAIGLIFLARYLKKRNEDTALANDSIEKIIIPPHITALEQLSNLKQDELYTQGLVKEHYVKLTDILRNYIENQFDIQATDETTDEILAELKRINIHKKDRSSLSKVLRLADFVKFAKAKPTVFDHENSLKKGIEFVEKTKPKDFKEVGDE